MYLRTKGYTAISKSHSLPLRKHRNHFIMLINYKWWTAVFCCTTLCHFLPNSVSLSLCLSFPFCLLPFYFVTPAESPLPSKFLSRGESNAMKFHLKFKRNPWCARSWVCLYCAAVGKVKRCDATAQLWGLYHTIIPDVSFPWSRIMRIVLSIQGCLCIQSRRHSLLWKDRRSLLWN
jgi:hypothetical protein